MPIVSGAYVAPTWQNNGPPPINASELQAMSDTIAENQGVPQLSNNIAPAFDSTENYSVDDYCIYDGILYRCTTAHQGAWTAGDFTEVSVGGDIANYLPTLFAPAGYGLGGTPVRLRGGDLNTVETCGFYYWASTDGVTNVPYADTSFCFNGGGCQIVIPRGNNLGKIAFRTKSSTWGAWYELAGTLKS